MTQIPSISVGNILHSRLPSTVVRKENPSDFGSAQPLSTLPLIPPDGAKRTDGYQIYLPNCGTIAFFMGLALSQPEAIKKLVVPLGDGGVRVSTDNRGNLEYWRLPPELSTLQSTPTTSTWLQVLEKTVATWYGGGYHGIGGLDTFSVGRVFGFTYSWVARADNTMPLTDATLYSYLSTQISEHRLTCVGTGATVRASGLYANHMYYLVDVTSTHVLLGNPWGTYYDAVVSLSDFLLQFDLVSSERYER